MHHDPSRRTGLKGAVALAAASLVYPLHGRAQSLKPGRLRVAVTMDVRNFDPAQFSFENAVLIKNLYDTLLDYTPEGRAIPALASAWTIGDGNTSVTLQLRRDVSFHTGAPFNAEAVAATLKKSADPKTGKNVYPTMSVVKDWTVVDPYTVRLNFNAPVPDRQITDLLQFISPIDPAAIATVEEKPAGTGPFMLAERQLGQRIRLVANPKYWREKPLATEIVITVFSDNEAANAALESGSVDIIYHGDSRSAMRLRSQGFQLVQSPGPLVQVFRINTTQGPFKNAKYRQAFNHLIDREAILKVGYAGLGETTSLPWVPASPAADPSYNQRYAFDLAKGQALLKESGLSAAEMSNWKLMANGGDQPTMQICQVTQATLAKVGINIQLDVKQGAEHTDSMLQGKFAAVFGGIGNVQKFPSRLVTNSIYRTVKNPILGDPHPFPEYVAAIDRVNTTLGSGDNVKAAYDNLNKVLIESSFGIPTNTYQVGLIVAAKNVGGLAREIDNMFAARTIGFV